MAFDWPRARVGEHARKYLSLVHLNGSEMKKPAQPSGGKQRVGIARALAIEPRMLLMNVPFSALEALTRGSPQDEVIALRRTGRKTIFLITRNVEEALLPADKILPMTRGPGGWIAELVDNAPPKRRAPSCAGTRPTIPCATICSIFPHPLARAVIGRWHAPAATRPSFVR